MNERSSETLLRFLRSIESGERLATHLFLLGDIFDFWVGDNDFFYRRFQPLVDSIRKIRSRGVRVEYFEGNHDLHLKRFWQGQLNIPVWTEERYVDLDGLTVRLEHGDLINPKDLSYLKFRSFLRRSSIERLAYTLPGRGLQALGSFLSHRSRKRSSVVRREQESEIRTMIRDHAERTFKEAPFDVIVTGHMHVQDEFEFQGQGKSVRSINLGSWFEKATAFHIEGRAKNWKFAWVDLSSEGSKNSVRTPGPPESRRD